MINAIIIKRILYITLVRKFEVNLHFSVTIFVLVFPLATAEEVDIREVFADKGTNVSIPCGEVPLNPASNVQWVHRGNKTHHKVLVSF